MLLSDDETDYLSESDPRQAILRPAYRGGGRSRTPETGAGGLTSRRSVIGARAKGRTLRPPGPEHEVGLDATRLAGHGMRCLVGRDNPACGRELPVAAVCHGGSLGAVAHGLPGNRRRRGWISFPQATLADVVWRSCGKRSKQDMRDSVHFNGVT